MGKVDIIDLELGIPIDSIYKENSIFIRYLPNSGNNPYVNVSVIQRYYKEDILWKFFPKSIQIVFDKNGRGCLPIYNDRCLFLTVLTETHPDLPDDLEFFLWHPEVFEGKFYK